MSWVCDKNSRFGFGAGPDPDPAYQWDTKRKLLSPAVVRALPGAILVTFTAKKKQIPEFTTL